MILIDIISMKSLPEIIEPPFLIGCPLVWYSVMLNLEMLLKLMMQDSRIQSSDKENNKLTWSITSHLESIHKGHFPCTKTTAKPSQMSFYIEQNPPEIDIYIYVYSKKQANGHPIYIKKQKSFYI